MDTAQLKRLLIDLKHEDPEFLVGLIGDVLTENLSIESWSSGDWYNPQKTYELRYEGNLFSKAY